MTQRPFLLALGGNAISPENSAGTITEQFGTVWQVAEYIGQTIRAGHFPILTHGNGPQVGQTLRRVEISRKQVYPLPLDIIGASTMGGMGYMIQQVLQNRFRKMGISLDVATIITQVQVAADDPDFQDPSKPIGSFYPEVDAQIMIKQYGWKMKEDAGRGWRRVVPSPRPLAIVQLAAIQALVENNILPICVGGGGVPVVMKDGQLQGVEGVIDKDRATSFLGTELKVPRLVITTGVEKVCIHFHQPGERELDDLTVSQAKEYFAAGEFPAGSMGPKIQASIDFIENGGEEVIITSLDGMQDALAGKTGTRLING